MTRRKRIAMAALSLSAAAGLGYAVRAARAAGIPSTAAMSYAGLLEDTNGPVNGMHNIEVDLYDAASMGNLLCQAPSTATNVVAGHFTIALPDACTTAVGANPNTWIDVLVDGSDTGRTKIGAVPYAVEANHAVNADNATNASNATGTLQGQIAALQGLVHPASAFRAHSSGAVNVASGNPDTTLKPDVVEYDLAAEYNKSTGTFAPANAGVYLFTCGVNYSATSSPAPYTVSIVVNAVYAAQQGIQGNNGLATSPSVATVIHLNPGDTVTCHTYQGTGTTLSMTQFSQTVSFAAVRVQ